LIKRQNINNKIIMNPEKPSKNKHTRRPAKSQPAQPTSRTIHIELTHPSATKVCVAGTFNNWKPEQCQMARLGGEKWTKDLTLEPGKYEYRLVVDGQWIADPHANNSVVNSFGEQNSVLTVL
jgi:1,4-alpha-glucan branching enzyme